MKRSAPMKRTGFKRKPTERGRAILAGTAPKIKLDFGFDVSAAVELPRPVVRPRARMAALLSAETPAPAPKEGRFESEAWRRAVAELPCVFCGKPSQAAHRNEGKGGMWKTDDCLTAAICPPEHAEIDQGRDMTREQRRARIDRAIVLTLRELVRRGKVGLIA